MLLGELGSRTAGRWLVSTGLLLLLPTLKAAAVASQCWQGATFSAAVVSPDVESSGIVRVPGVMSLAQCVAACCDLRGYDLAWLFEGHCYILSCQQRANCRPQERPGADSVLVFLRRTSPQTLILQSLVRGDPYEGRWRPPSQIFEDLESLKDLAQNDGSQQNQPELRMQDYSEGRPEETSHISQTDRPSVTGRPFNQSEAEEGPDQGLTGSDVDQRRAMSQLNTSQAAEGGSRSPAEPQNLTQAESVSGADSPPLQLTTDSARYEVVTSLPGSARPTSTSAETGQPLIPSPGNPVDHRPSPQPTTGLVTVFRPAVRAPPASTGRVLTFDPTTIRTPGSPPTTPPTTTTTTVAFQAEVKGSNGGPVAIVGPDRRLFLPVDSLLLDGSGSTDDRGIVSYRWDAVSGPTGLKLDGADRAVATVTGLEAGQYTFRLTVCDQQGATDSALLSVRVLQNRRPPPVAHASGSHTLTLPNNSLVLPGSVTDGDQSEVHFLWVRDRQSPAAGDVLYGSDSQASLYLANLVQGTYLFRLKVTDALGRSSSATATVEVRPERGGGQEVELEMLVPVSQISVAQRDTVIRQLAALLHVLNGDVQVRALQGRSDSSTVLRFSVRGPTGPMSGSRLAVLLRNELLGQKNDFLLFRVLRVDAVSCLLRCSGRGQCDPVSKECRCDLFWTENPIRRYFGDGESNCEWRILYVILTSFLLVVFVLSISWTFICCCKRRRQTKVRRKTRYTILDNMDDQERVELRPKFSIKHRSTEHNSSLMMSESELDSDQDNTFSQDGPTRSRNRGQASRCGNTFG
ncbi:dyslexia-associated protein KIAA0319 isoform X3 [Takifugu rubripes]|uniref:KIAA0319 n=1 Tax=Takifugu rubripes TaxID=31033 RepID=A0A674PNJ7_TAKRU|nr:dyslexia-associated protein KIAA0319-like isoform X3 [Takifugu rubripes]